ncbi:sulfatase-like hydrolase/transferase [Kiritimatiellaeota bacterium B1221]|nr:sulfatase-like hydrolase/transferase [Kiritimatiellaeota bacterium B1221]
MFKTILRMWVICFGALQIHAQNPPNILLIMMDDLGANDLGSYQFPFAGDTAAPPSPAPNSPENALDPNAAVGATPRIDSLASSGLRFTHFYATSSVCSPTRAALMTGCYPRRVRIEKVLSAGKTTRGLNPSEVTLPELLREQGYLTAMAGKWHLGDSIEYNPTRHGFEQYFGILYSSDMWSENPYNSTWPPLKLMQGEQALTTYTTATGGIFTGNIDSIAEQSYLLEAETEHIISAMDQAVAEDRPFFLYFAPHSPHVPVHPHPDFLSAAGESDDEARYLDVLKELDYRVGQLLDRIDHHGIAHETIVIVTSDNGPWQNPPGAGSLFQGAGSGYPFQGAKHSNWEGGHRVPFLIRYPGVIPAGEIRNQTAATHDLLPTLLAFTNGDLPPDRVMDGVNIQSILTGSRSAEPHTAFYYYASNATSATGMMDTTQSAKFKLGTNGRLYKIGTAFTEDFQELTNVSTHYPEVKTSLQAALSTWNSGMSPREAASAKDIQIELSTDRVDVTEGGNATAGIRLSAPAAKTVTTAWFSGDADLKIQSGQTLIFNESNWNQWQYVTFHAVGDADERSDGATFRVGADDLHLREIFVFENETGISNTPPVIRAQAPANSEIHFPDLSSRLLMQVMVSDDSLPEPETLTLTWSQIEGPGAATFSESHLSRTFVAFPESGLYHLRCEVTDGVYQRAVDFKVQAGPLPNGPAERGFVFYYNFEEATGTTTADMSETAGNAFLSEDAVLTAQGPAWTTGKTGNALAFDGLNDLVVTPSVAVNATSAWSASAWVWLNERPASGSRVILQQANAESGTGRTWLYVTSTGALASYLGGREFSGGEVPVGEWAHVAVTSAEGVNSPMNLYINGKNVKTVTGTIEAATGVFHVGDHKDLENTSSLNWSGKMDEIKLYRRELETEELSSILTLEWERIETFNTWISQYTSIPEAQRTAHEDYMGDGVPHLVDYAHGIDATADASPFLMSGASINLAGENFLQIQYRRLQGGVGQTAVDYAVAGILYQVEQSTRLGSGELWQGGADFFQPVGNAFDNQDGTETVTVRSTQAGIPPHTHMFIRLQISQY